MGAATIIMHFVEVLYSNQDEWRYTQQLLDRSVVYTDVFSMKDHSDTVGNTETMMI